MTRRHHRHPETVQEFVDATVDHLEEYLDELVQLPARLTARPGAPSWSIDRRGKLALRPQRQDGGYPEIRRSKRFSFRIRLEIEPVEQR